MSGEDTKNIRNYYPVDENRYPEAYYQLSRSSGVGILDLMNNYDKIAQDYYAKFMTSTDDDERSNSLMMYSHYNDKLSAFKNAYEIIGIMVERWGSDPDKPWILACRDDAVYYNNHLNDDDDVVGHKSDRDYGFWNDRPVKENGWPAPEGDKYTKSYEKKRYFRPQEVQRKLERAGSYWYDSSTGTYYNDAGQVVMHDGVYREKAPSTTISPDGTITYSYN